jgi:3-oxoacyl-[acyl-carrier protein] reductase
LSSRPYGIRVNRIAPETILTENHEQRIPDEQKAAPIEAHPIKRLGTPDDVARAVLLSNLTKSETEIEVP